MSSGADFEATLEALGQARESSEGEYFRALEDLRARAKRLLVAMQEAEELAARGTGVVGGPAAGAPSELPEPALSDPRAGQEPWPRDRAGLRGVLNGAVRWLLRDFLATLDTRHEAVERALQRQQRESRTLLEHGLEAAAGVGAASRRRDAEILEATAAADARLRELTESLREAANRAAEAIDSLADLAERARLLADAKDAENLQRATRGPARKMEIMFEEFGRQQEALLAQLVGRRRDLDALIRELATEGSSAEP